MLDSLAALITLAGLTLAAVGLGRPMFRGLLDSVEYRRGEFAVGPSAVAELAFSLGLGWVAWGTLWMGLGFAGGLYLPLMAALTAPAAAWGVVQLQAWWRTHAGAWRVEADEPPDEHDAAAEDDTASPALPFGEEDTRRTRRAALGVLTLAAIAALAALVAALAPPTAGDALCYHLELPKRFLAAHGLLDLPYSDNATFPLLAEMWYLWALAIGGPTAAQLVHWEFGLLLALAAWALAEPIVGRGAGALAAAVTLLVPGVTNQMTAPLNDVALAALATLGLAAWWRAAVDGERPGWYAAAGLAWGGALGTKYLALVFLAAVGLVTLGAWLRRPRDLRWGDARRLALGAAMAATVAVSVAGPWYLRAAWLRGNPVYPFFARSTSAASTEPGEPSAAAPLPETLRASKAPLGRTPWAVAAAPWAMTIQPERFGGRGHQLGAVFLALAPLVAVGRRLRGIGWMLAVAGVYGAAVVLLRQNVRFLLPLVPPLAIVAVWAWRELAAWPAWPRRIVTLVVGGLLLFQAAVAVRRGLDELPVAVGLETPTEYLVRHEPTWPIAQELNARLPADATLLSGECRLFYIAAPTTQENVYRRQTGYDRHTAPEMLAPRLLEAGFSHLLVVEGQGGDASYDPAWPRLVARAAETPSGPRLLWQTDVASHDGARRQYRVYALR